MILRPVIYEHFKEKKQYRVIGIAKHSETLEDVVVYEPLYENPTSTLWVRPLASFLEEVDIDGARILRFIFLRDE